MNYPYCVKLNNGLEIPKIALGTWESADGETVVKSIKYAVDAGYRSVDTAYVYYNEKGVGRGIRQCGLPREEIFLTTKVWNGFQGYDNTMKQYDISIKDLDCGYIDMLLIHWPCPRNNKYVETYKALEDLYKEKKLRAIGVCNFTVEHLKRLLSECEIVPAVNQIEMHPRLIQPELMAFCADKGIRIEAYSPLMHGGQILSDPLITELAGNYRRTNAQIILRYLVQLGARVLVKSVHRDRIESNQQIFDFELSLGDMERIGSLNDGTRTCPHPDLHHMGAV